MNICKFLWAIDYSMFCTINNSIIPGMPKNPVITAVNGLITRFNPMSPPIKLNNNKKTPPIIPFAINFIISLIGITSNIPIMYNRNNPNMKANIVPISIISPPIIFPLLYNRRRLV